MEEIHQEDGICLANELDSDVYDLQHVAFQFLDHL